MCFYKKQFFCTFIKWNKKLKKNTKNKISATKMKKKKFEKRKKKKKERDKP